LSRGEFLGDLSPRLTSEQPMALVPKRSAGVAVIFSDSGGPEKVLLIRRAEREGDPWSGQVAFPGGRVSRVDASFEETARREAAEEVGVNLSPGTALFFGYMKEFRAKVRQVSVVPSVFRLNAPPRVTTNAEVASYHWVPLRALAKQEARSTFPVRLKGERIPFPSLVYQGLVVWGLTERILSAIIWGAAAEDRATTSEVERY